jgi:hypothetical protein
MRGTVPRSIGARSPPRFRRIARVMRELFSPLVDRVFVLVRSLGPYAAIELLLPGGSMLALLYWWYRQRVSRTRAEPRLDTGSNLALDFRRGEP